MVGELLWTLCGNHNSDKRSYFELWSYPDGTLNFVTSECKNYGLPELSFPCISDQLVSALNEGKVRLHNETHFLELEPRENCVCGVLRDQAGTKLCEHCMDRLEYREMLESIYGLPKKKRPLSQRRAVVLI